MKKKIITLCLGVFALTLLTSCKCDKNKEQVAAAQPETGVALSGTLDPKTGNFIYNTGEIFTLKLPNEVKLEEIGESSTETKLFNFLNDSNVTVSDDKTHGWITLDRVYFETGKSTLTAESDKQVKNLAEILKAYPNAKVRIGGYTDNTGNVEVNKKVSEERAKMVAGELVKLGVSADRVPSEGYGQEHPICVANDTPECKAQNRRVDIRITEK